MSLAYGTPGQEVLLPNMRGRIVAVTMDTSYPTGGYSVTASNVGLENVQGALDIGSGVGGYKMVYNPSTAKLQAFVPIGAAAIALTGQAGGIANNNVFTAPTSPAPIYELDYAMVVTTPATGANNNTTGLTVNVNWTDTSNNAHTYSNTTVGNAAANVGGSYAAGVLVLTVYPGTVVTANVASTGNPPANNAVYSVAVAISPFGGPSQLEVPSGTNMSAASRTFLWIGSA